ncbi:Mur ligase family protein [Gleimia coleocanis]|nr:Mur ligase family protein [Gleimia coleocanis]
MRQVLTTAIGKTIRAAMRLRGGGSALPGLIVEKIDPQFMARTLETLPRGVVVVSGTNGKTTTTKMVVELLEAAGLKVFTNRTGSNFSRGVVASLLGEINGMGKLDADIAVLELDEAWAVHFVKTVRPRYSLLLNVMRDQLDRFGEIDTTAGFLQKIAEATQETVVLNRDDSRVYAIHQHTRAQAKYFGLTTELIKLMPSDDSLKTGDAQANDAVACEVLLTEVGDQVATFQIGADNYQTEVAVNGVYNLLNAAAALSLAKTILPQTPTQTFIDAVALVKPAFGRGESINYKGTAIDLLLVKNPSGFRLSLLSFGKRDRQTMIAINDNYADGRDLSWLWDVDFTLLSGIHSVTGARAADMALRLHYDGVEIGQVQPDLKVALEDFLNSEPGKDKQIFCSYTAMLTLRKLLSEKTEVEDIS